MCNTNEEVVMKYCKQAVLIGILLLFPGVMTFGSVTDVINDQSMDNDTTPYQSILCWGSFGVEDGQFRYPQGVCVDHMDYVYVCDGGYNSTSNHRVQKFTSTGVYVDQWGSQGTGSGQFSNRLLGITTDSQYIYVVDHDNRRIQKFTLDGGFVLAWGNYGSGPGQFISAHGITHDRDNCFYVVDDVNHRIQKFTSTGTYLKEWYCGGSPRHSAVDTAYYVYVTDHLAHVVRKYDSSGTFIMSWGGYGTNPGQFAYPAGIAIDRFGYLYVADQHNHRIQKFTRDGVFITTFGVPGNGWPGEMLSPWQLTVDKRGYVYVSEGDGQRIHKWGVIADATIDIEPDILNLRSAGRRLLCYIELPAGYGVEDIDISTIAITAIDDTAIYPPIYRTGPTDIGDYDGDSIPDLKVEFDKRALAEKLDAILQHSADVQFTIEGEIETGGAFNGVDTIYVIIPQGSNKDFRSDKSQTWCSITKTLPNPVRSTAVFYCTMHEDAYVDMKIYDVNGRLITVLLNEHMKADDYEIRWDGKDTRGNEVKNGVYFCRMTAAGNTTTEKILMLR